MSAPPRFFLEEPPLGKKAALAEGEAEHATRVLRLGAGDACVGLDGRGGAWPLRFVAAGRRALAVEVTGPAVHEPEPGAPGAELPWIEVAVAWPRRPRAEEMLGRLTQLGAARITPLAAKQSGAQPPPDPADARWTRLLREACKQSGRTWLPELGDARTALELALACSGEATALLDPAGGMGLDTWARSLPRVGGGTGGPRGEDPASLGTRDRPILLVVGPEGGFDAAERDAFMRRGASSVRVAPHVLRIETAAEAATAVVAALWMRPRMA